MRFVGAVLCLGLAGASGGLFGQMLYVGNSGDRTISAYVIDMESGMLTEVLPRVDNPGSPQALAVHPNKKFVYVSNGGGGTSGPNLAAYSINGSTGALTLAGSSPLVPGSGPQGVAIDPSGKLAFVAHQGANNVSAFSIDPSTGATTAVPGSPFTAPTGPNSVVVHPNGKFAYVSAAGAGQIAVFRIGADGALSAVDGSPFAARNNLFWMTMDAAGKFLFAVERQDNAVLVYSVNETTGALTPVGTRFPAGPGVSGVAVDPAGKFLYVSNFATGSVTVFEIGATGELTRRGDFGVVLEAFAAILDPSGKFLYVPGQGAGVIGAMAINPNSGALTPVPQQWFPAGVQPRRGVTVLLDPPILPPINADSAFNAFSVSARGMPNGGIAQGSLFSVSGQNIGPAEEASQEEFPLKTELAGVSIQIQSGDVSIAAIMLEASNNRVTGIIPSTTPLGDATVTVTYKGRTTTPLPVTIVTTSAGLATRSRTGAGPTLETLNANPDTVVTPAPVEILFSLNLPTNGLHRSAKPGQRLIIEATGLGPATYDETLDSAQSLDVAVDVMVGNKLATVISKVRIAGYDFILLQLPDDVQEGCYVPIAIRAGGVTSNVASISVAAAGGSCSDPAGLSSADIDAAQKAGKISMGTITLGHIDFSPLGTSDSASGTFASIDFNSLLKSFAPGINRGGIRASFSTPPLGTCTVSQGVPTDPENFLEVPSDPTPLVYLNAGQTVNLSGPGDAVQLAAPFYRFETETNAFKPGDYTVENGAGTQMVGPFKGTLTLPPMVNWTNQDALTSPDRTQPLTVTWSGGVADKELVGIFGVASSEQASAGFFCTEKASAGTFTVPAWVLSSLPASATFTDGGQSLPGGLLGVGTAPLTNAGRFTAPGLDFGVFTYEQAKIRLVSYK